MGTLWLAVPRFVCQLHLTLHELSEHLQLTPGRFGICGLGRVVGIATGYGLDGAGIESR
jgi:hypothetical protein